MKTNICVSFDSHCPAECNHGGTHNASSECKQPPHHCTEAKKVVFCIPSYTTDDPASTSQPARSLTATEALASYKIEDPNWISETQIAILKQALGKDVVMAMEMMEPTMPVNKIEIERETAINNIAVSLWKAGLLNIKVQNPESRLEPFLSLSPVVGVIADVVDAATINPEVKGNAHSPGK